jgi:uncharacterized membrane protein (UPF0127 family)
VVTLGYETSKGEPVRAVQIRNLSRGVDLAERAEVATNPWTRFLGLMGRRTVLPGGGLLIRPCNSIHMFFMRMSLDVIHCGAPTDGTDPILRLLPGIKPWRLGPLVRGSKYVVELPAGTLARTGTSVGDRIALVYEDV